MGKILVDSYAWIAHFRHEAPGKSTVECRAESGDDLFTASVTLAEVARKFHRDQLAAGTAMRRLEQISLVATIVELNGRIAWAAAEADLELRRWAKHRRLDAPGLFDAIILGTARQIGAKVLTGDPHFEGLPETDWME